MSGPKHAEILEEIRSRLDATKRQHPRLAEQPLLAGHLTQVPTIVCAGGLKMSVQASRYHYCTPRDSVGPWSSVEIGFPSQRVERLMFYAEDGSAPTDTVYGYVPIEVVAEVIAEHGGFARATRSKAGEAS